MIRLSAALILCAAFFVGSCVYDPIPRGHIPEPLLIAHRGGVVGDTYAENSPGAVEAAIAAGYWMIEVDVRESADGKMVVHHDEDFQRFYGDARQLAEMSWDEIAGLVATPGGSRPMLFSELAALCRGRMRLMLDTKPPEHSEAFFDELESVLVENDLLESAFIIGTDQSRRRFLGKAKVGVDRSALKEALDRDESVTSRYFLFEHGRDLDAETVHWAEGLGVDVVPSINIFHYDDLPDHFASAKADVGRMHDAGVVYFQIDSVYDEWLQ